jgi:hypothetical protein
MPRPVELIHGMDPVKYYLNRLTSPFISGEQTFRPSKNHAFAQLVVNGASAHLVRANLFQTMMSFEGGIDARIEFRFGLFADNACRLRDGLDNKALGL